MSEVSSSHPHHLPQPSHPSNPPHPSRSLVVGLLATAGLLGACLGSPQPASAQTPQGGDFPVGSLQGGDPAVAWNGSDRFLVVWRALLHPADSTGIVGQVMDAQGQAVGDEFLVNSYTTGGQFDPSIAVDGSGQFVVVWSSNDSDDVRGQRLDSDGSPIGSEFVVPSDTAGTGDRTPEVASSDYGDFVVTWTADGAGGVAGDTIQARRFSRDAVPQGSQFQVNVATAYSQEFPDVVVRRATGDFIVSWESSFPMVNDEAVFRRYSSAGSALSGEIVANSESSLFEHQTRLAMDAEGDFLVLFNDQVAADRSRVALRSYLADGTPVSGQQATVNASSVDDTEAPEVAMQLDSTFLVGWTSRVGLGSDPDGQSLRAVQVNRLGFPGTEFQLNTTTAGDQDELALAWDGRGRLAAVWRSGSNIRGRIFHTSVELFPGLPVSDQVIGLRRLSAWRDYYVLVAKGATELRVDLTGLPISDPDDVDLYLRHGDRPTDAAFDCKSALSSNLDESCVVQTPAAGVWWVGISNWDLGGAIAFDVEVTLDGPSSLIFADGFESGNTSAW